MRKDQRRQDIKTVAKIQEIRNIKNAFGEFAAQLFSKRYFLDLNLVRIAMSSRFERRQCFRRAMDQPADEGATYIHKISQ